MDNASFSERGKEKRREQQVRMARWRDRVMPWLVSWKKPNSRQAVLVNEMVWLRDFGVELGWRYGERSIVGMETVG
jgi:hypothetical protein